MSEFFWESVQKARKEHFCDSCHHWIQPGEVYVRSVWVPHGTRSFHVMKEHGIPGCPDPDEEIETGMTGEDGDDLGVSIVFVAEVREVLKIGVDGKTISESEIYFTPKLVCEAITPSGTFCSDDETPF